MNRFRCQVCMLLSLAAGEDPEISIKSAVQINIRILMATKSSDHETFVNCYWGVSSSSNSFQSGEF